MDDIATVTPELEANCRKLISRQQYPDRDGPLCAAHL